MQSNGKIIVVGAFTIGNNSYRNVARLNTDGSLDTTFADLTAYAQDLGQVYDVIVSPDDAIYLLGNFNGRSIYKLNSDGTLNLSAQFSNGNISLLSLGFQSDGKIVAGGGNVVRYMPNGNTDNSFPPINANNIITKVIVQPNNKIIIAGSFTTVNGFPQGRITRLNIDGSIDTTFNPSGIGADVGIQDAALDINGKILIIGAFSKYNNIPKSRVARLNPDGTLDNSFTLDSSISANITFNSLSVKSDGKIYLTSNTPNLSVYRLNTDGTRDTTFAFASLTFGRGGTVSDIIQQPDGKILVAGGIRFANGVPRANIVRFNLDGSLDTSFSYTNNLFAEFIRLAVQPDGKIIVSAGENANRVFRLNADGSTDNTFIGGGFKYDIEILADGKILLGEQRVTASGGLDNTYTTPTLNGAVTANKAVSDGKYLIGGTFTQVNGVLRGGIARLNNSGTLDTTFNSGLGANGNVADIDLQTDGKVIIAGGFTGLNGVPRIGIARLNTDGSLDADFNAEIGGGAIVSMKVQSDNKILIAGTFTSVAGVPREHYARLNANGSLDNAFIVESSNIFFQQINRITTQSDGNVLLGGYISRIRNFPVVNVARLLNNTTTARTPYDYDRDGRADVSLFRPSNGTWYLLNSTTGFSATQFGQAGDQIVPADYNGDGKTDIAVFRANGFGYFYILNSGNNSYRPEQFGQTGDVPLAGDWDGDGVGDLAVYRDGSLTGGASAFYYRPSSQSGVNFRPIVWGAAGDKPVLGDFDGDGQLDAAVFRPSTAHWYILKSSDNQVIDVFFGRATDILTPADFNGDGKTDFGMFRPDNGTWYYSSSWTNPGTNFTAVPFGQAGDVPVAADYDGDGRADVGVFRPSNGTWYVQRSTQGFTGVQFGSTGDKPAPNAYNK